MPITVTTIVYTTSAITIHCPTPGLNGPKVSETPAASHGRHEPSNANGIAAMMAIGSSGTSLQMEMILGMRISLRSYRTPC